MNINFETKNKPVLSTISVVEQKQSNSLRLLG
jgi:hypothetical protein